MRKGREFVLEQRLRSGREATGPGPAERARAGGPHPGEENGVRGGVSVSEHALADPPPGMSRS